MQHRTGDGKKEKEKHLLMQHLKGNGSDDHGFRFRVQGLGFRVSGFGFRVHGLGFRVHCLGFRVHCLGLRA